MAGSVLQQKAEKGDEESFTCPVEEHPPGRPQVIHRLSKPFEPIAGSCDALVIPSNSMPTSCQNLQLINNSLCVNDLDGIA